MELTGGCVAAGHVTIASLDDPTPFAPQKRSGSKTNCHRLRSTNRFRLFRYPEPHVTDIIWP